jgi:hypothetical protein
MGWAAGFQAGSQVARNALDAYYGAKERKEIEDLNKQAPETYEGVSPQNQQFLKNVESAVDAQGNPVYQLDQATPGKFGLSVRNAEGGYTPVEGPGISTPREQRVRYLGREYGAEQFNPDVQRAARTQALTDIVSKYRPAEGVRLGLEAQKATDEAEARRYAVSQRPMEERRTAAQVAAAEATTAGLVRGEATASTVEEAALQFAKDSSKEGFDPENWYRQKGLPAGVEGALREQVNKVGTSKFAAGTIEANQNEQDFQKEIRAYKAKVLKETGKPATVDQLVGYANNSKLNSGQLTKFLTDLTGAGAEQLKLGEVGEGLSYRKFLDEYKAAEAGAKEMGTGPVDPLAFANQMGLSDANKTKFLQARYGLSDAKLKAYRAELDEKLSKVQNLDQLQALHKSDSNFDPNAHFEYAEGADGKITVTMHKTDTGERIASIAPRTFKNRDEAFAALTAQAKGADAAITYFANKQEADSIQALRGAQAMDASARAKLSEENIKLVGPHVKLYNAQADKTAAEGKEVAATAQAQRNRDQAAIDYNRAQIKQLDKTKNEDLLMLLSTTDGSIILADKTKLPKNANGTMSVPDGYTIPKGNTELENIAYKEFVRWQTENPSATAAEEESIKQKLGLTRISPVKGLNPGPNTDKLGPKGVNAPAPTGLK